MLVFPQTFWGHSVDRILVLEHCEMPFSPNNNMFGTNLDLDNLCQNAAAICWEKNLGGHLLLTILLSNKRGRCRQCLCQSFLLFADFPIFQGRKRHLFIFWGTVCPRLLRGPNTGKYWTFLRFFRVILAASKQGEIGAHFAVGLSATF